MVLVNAPVTRDNPAHHGVRLAIDMQVAVQSLANRWYARGYGMGFGVGIAMGPATVGTVGYEGRLDYTAIGNVVNLASRLCDSADDAQILVDAVIAGKVKDSVAMCPSESEPSRATIMHCRSLLWRTAPLPSAIRATSKSDGSSIRRSWRCEYEKKRALSAPCRSLHLSAPEAPCPTISRTFGGGRGI